MANSEELQIVIRAVDEASKVLKDVKKQLGGTSTEVQKYAKDTKAATAGSSELHKEWQKLFSTSKYLEEGVQELRTTLTNVLWSNVALAVATVVMQFAAWAIESVKAKENTKELTDAIEDQARGWGLLPDKIKDVTQATIDLYNIKLLMAQHDERKKGKELEGQIKELTELNEQLQRNLSALERFPEVAAEGASGEYKLLDTLPGKILKNKLAMAELKVELEAWQKLQNMKPADRSKVNSYINKDEIKQAREARQTLLEQWANGEYQFGLMVADMQHKHHDDIMNKIEARIKKRQEEKDKELTAEEEGLRRAEAIQQKKQDVILGSLAFISRSALREHKAFFAIVKAADIAQATMDTCTAATKAYKDVPYPFNIALSGMIYAAGMANVAKIAGTGFGGSGSGGGGGGGAIGSATSGAGTGSPGAVYNANPSQSIQIIVNGNIVDHAAFVRELQPYFKEVQVDTL